MEQPTIGCKYPGVHNEVSTGLADTSLTTTGRPPLLRRMSRSDPHLDVPHFVNAQDKGFSTFHHVLSGLFEGNSTFSINKIAESRDNLLHHNVENKNLVPAQESLKPPASLDRNKSAVELVSQGHDHSTSTQGSALRKVSSVANYGPHGEIQDHTLIQYNPNVYSGGQHNNEDQGLMMSLRPKPLITSTSGLHQSTIPESSGSNMSTPTTATPPVTRAGGVMGIFGRGFFAKPVIRNEEENYRYIMALDR
jgi:hypothetical protein